MGNTPEGKKARNTKYTYYLPVQVGPNGQLELPAAIANQIKMQALKGAQSAEITKGQPFSELREDFQPSKGSQDSSSQNE